MPKPQEKNRQSLRNTLNALGEDFFSSAIDATLWSVVFLADLMVPQPKNSAVYRSGLVADHFLDKHNYETIKHAVANARRHGFIKKIGRGRRAIPEITEAGKKRLTTILPAYDEKRVWDQRLHLVTYDIPEKKRHDRELLREYLRRIGCGMLQESVWITPYNPIDTIRTFIEENNLAGTIIISDLGSDASIGEEDIHTLLERIYKLDKLNDRYEELLKDSRQQKNGGHNLLLSYLAILRDDPQLPFSLLPSWWKGDEAYHRVKNQAKELLFKMRPHSS